MKPRALLLNPPADKNWGRDYFLGGELEEGLCLPPQDLVTLSGILSARADIAVVDAPAERLSEEKALSRVRSYRPSHVVFLTSAASYAQDVRFMEKLKEQIPAAQLIGIGDFYRDIKELAFALNPFLDAMILDFTTETALSCLGDGKEAVENVLFRNGRGAGPERHRFGPWRPAMPRWDLFPLENYRWPFAGPGPCATLLTAYGCPYLCTYCPISSLAYKTRGVDSVVEEARALKGLGVRNLFFRDQTFGVDWDRTRALLDRLEREGLNFSWVCSTRVDLLDAERLKRMKQAGCAAILFGIDSGDDEVLRAHKKNTTLAQAEHAVGLAKQFGLGTWGAFVIGLSMDTRQSLEQTLRAAKKLPLDHVSLRIDSSRLAADYRRDMLVKGLAPPESMPPDTPTSISAWGGRLGVSNLDVFAYYKRYFQDARNISAASPA